EDMDVPVIAAVNGFAVTGGFELALACDIMLASDTARFADTHGRVGVMPGGGMTARLPRAVGIRKAKELSLTGNYLSAQEAEKLGLVNRVVPKEKLMDAARELAGQILSVDPLMTRQLKRLYDLTSRATLADAIRIEQDFSRAHSLSRDLGDMETRRRLVMERGRVQKANR
ncbi:MAG TPA: enoyl-CoA hydratase-related protein, partial [Candidatus Binataceae bacterium]|nr:enoyl-CoA hydratase-related protein [Candidatus Binataceae bacterium]